MAVEESFTSRIDVDLGGRQHRRLYLHPTNFDVANFPDDSSPIDRTSTCGTTGNVIGT